MSLNTLHCGATAIFFCPYTVAEAPFQLTPTEPASHLEDAHGPAIMAGEGEGQSAYRLRHAASEGCAHVCLSPGGAERVILATMGCVSALLLSIDPAPAAAERIIARLPAQLRAALQWYPPAFRRDVLEPLRAAQALWRESAPESCLTALRLVNRFGHAIAAAFTDPHARDLLAAAADAGNPTEALIASRLEPVDALAADELREGLEWMRALLPVVSTALSVPDVVEKAVLEMQTGDEAALREALRGDLGVFIRGLVMLAAASEAVADASRPLPPAIAEWCHEAFSALHSAIRSLRGRGVPFPFEVSIPGYTAKQWRERWAARVFEGLSDENMAQVNDAMIRRPRVASPP